MSDSFAPILTVALSGLAPAAHRPEITLILLAVLLLSILASRYAKANPSYPKFPKTTTADEAPGTGHPICRPKPPWVRDKVLYLKALMPNDGCRTIAAAFCLLYGHLETVRKTYVAERIKESHEEILRLRKDLKHRKPRPMPRNITWGMDLTYLHGRKRPILAIVDHGSRACLFLEELKAKSAIVIARALIAAAKKYGLPRSIRTDNEANFCSRRLAAILKILDVKHQRTTPHCPWQNGRVERFFGSFKERMLPRLAELRAAGVEPADIQVELDIYRRWYNHVRPHQHLDGRTPADVWEGRSVDDIFGTSRQTRFFSEWEGLLVGFTRY